MPKYAALYEAEIQTYITVNGCIAIQGVDYESEKPTKILMSVRQAKFFLDDLPDLIKMANVSVNDYIENSQIDSDE